MKFTFVKANLGAKAPIIKTMVVIKGCWEAIFRVTGDFHSMKGGVKLYMHEGY